MPNAKLLLASPIPLLLLAACGNGSQRTAAENGANEAEADVLENAAPSNGQINASERTVEEPVPPPDAVSHPEGYLPPVGDPPPAPGPEPKADPKEPPPATEDEYISNRQAGA